MKDDAKEWPSFIYSTKNHFTKLFWGHILHTDPLSLCKISFFHLSLSWRSKAEVKTNRNGFMSKFRDWRRAIWILTRVCCFFFFSFYSFYSYAFTFKRTYLWLIVISSYSQALIQFPLFLINVSHVLLSLIFISEDLQKMTCICW